MGYCVWAGMNEANRTYHNTEWGIPVHSHLQAFGIINDHDKDCPCYVKINKGHPTIRKRRDHEVM